MCGPTSFGKIHEFWMDYPYYDDVKMGAMASQITSLTIVYTTVYSDADQRKHQSSASLAFVRGIHRSPVPAQMASNAENISIWWRHHVYCFQPQILETISQTSDIISFILPVAQFYRYIVSRGRCMPSPRIDKRRKAFVVLIDTEITLLI